MKLAKIKNWQNKAKRSWSSNWVKTFSAFGIVVVLLGSFLILRQSAQAATTVSTSTASVATEYSQQRKTWYDGTRYWAAFNANSRIEFWYSTDGSSWTENTSARIAVNTNDFSLDADSTNAFIAYPSGGNIAARAASSYPGTAFTWGTATNAFSGSELPVIDRDSNNKVRISAQSNTFTDPDTTYYWYSALSTNANDVSSWGAAVQLDSRLNNGNLYGAQAKLSGGDMYAVSINGNVISGKKNTGGTWDTNWTRIATGVTGTSKNMSMVSDATDDSAYLSYINSSNNTVFRKYNDNTLSSASKIDDAGNPGFSGQQEIVRATNGDLYMFFRDTPACEMWLSTDEGANWTQQDSAHNPPCTNSADTKIAIGTDDIIHLIYNDGSVLKYNTFSTATNLFGTAETALNHSITAVALSLDSNNKPHVVSLKPGITVSYSNRVSGSWKTPVTFDSWTTTVASISMTISEDNIPELCYINGTDADLTAAVGDQNDAASFTMQDVDTTVPTALDAACSIATDSTGNTWMGYIDENGATDFVTLVKHNDADAWSTWQTPVTNSNAGSSVSLATISDDIYIFYNASASGTGNIIYNEYVNSAWKGQTTVATGAFDRPSARWSKYGDTSDKPLDFYYDDATDIYYHNLGVWQPSVTLDSGTSNAYTSISKAASGDLYLFWISASNIVYYKKGVAPYNTADWDTNPTTIVNTNTNKWLTSGYQEGGFRIPVIWTEGSGSPFNIKFDAVNLNSPPNAPTLSSPADGAHPASVTPQLQMSATDPDGDSIKYKVLIYNTAAQSGGNCSGTSFETADQNSSGTGWDNGTTAYSSGATATYTVQTSMTRGNVYCWQAQGKDPSGINTFGALSTPSTFTINSTPAAPTLSSPANSATSVGTRPRLELRSTDADSDYLKYKIEVCTTSNCSAVLRTIDQTSSQTGWQCQDASSGTAYVASTTIGSSTMACHYYQVPGLLPNTQYWWRAYAIDPAGVNTFSGASSIFSFTTNPLEIRIEGGVKIQGGTKIGQ